MRQAGRTIALAALALVLAASGACGGRGPDISTPTTGVTPSGNRIIIQSFAFVPASLTVNAGDTVTWENKDAVAHLVAGTDWASESLGQGAIYSRKFDAAGTFTFHCSIHPLMTGTVIVR